MCVGKKGLQALQGITARCCRDNTKMCECVRGQWGLEGRDGLARGRVQGNLLPGWRKDKQQKDIESNKAI